MTNTYYTSMSGMLAASFGLQNTSNNVANMQSPGFKRNDVFYSSLGNGSGEEGLGSGVHIGGNATNFSEGKYLETNNPSDLAVVGQGFFVIRLKNEQLLYTRDGEFGFDNDGILIDRHSGGQVQGYDGAGNLVPIHAKGPKVSAGKATHEVFLNGIFVVHEIKKDTPSSIDEKKYENVKITLTNIYDAQGKKHTIDVEFESKPDIMGHEDGKNWKLINLTCNDAQIDPFVDQEIIFNIFDYGPNELNSSIFFTLNGQQTVSINFGNRDDGSDHSVQLKESKLNPGGTSIEIYQNDGYGEGKQISFSFDEDGQISYNYDNGQNITGIHVGLARFDDLENTLVQTQDNLFRAKSNKGVHWGRANQNGFGAIKAKQLESSNVDSTTEFANIVILQRMFQACSQIMDIDKQLLEELEAKS